jgi:2-dehydropantoate 2-reductase
MGAFSHPETLAPVAELFLRAGLDCRVLPDLGLARWRKLVWNVPFNGLAIAGGGIDTQQILADPALLARTRALMDEVITVAAALCTCGTLPGDKAGAKRALASALFTNT